MIQANVAVLVAFCSICNSVFLDEIPHPRFFCVVVDVKVC